MKRAWTSIALVLTAALLTLYVSSGGGSADAQPITGGGGLFRVFHSPAFYGLGTSGTQLDLRHDCSTGSGLAWSGSSWDCSAMGGGGGGSGFTIAGTGLTGSGSAVNVNATSGGMIAVGSDTIGLDGSGCSSGWVPTWGGSSWSCAAAGSTSPSLSISSAQTTGTPNLTTLGTKDWLVYAQNTPTGQAAQYWRKRDGGRQIEVPQWVGAPTGGGVQTRNQAVTWTASDNLSLGSAGSGFKNVDLIFLATGNTGFGFSTSAPSVSTSQTFTVYVANFNETDGVQCFASLADNSTSPVNTTFTMTGIDNWTVTVTFQSARATRVVVTCVITSNPAGANLGWLAMWLA